MKLSPKYFLLMTLGVALGSCSPYVADLDIDPNNPSNVAAPNTIQGVMLADALVHEAESARLSAMWTAQFTGAERQYVSLNQYDVTAGSFDDIWDTSYYGIITQARLTGTSAANLGLFRLQGVTQILEAHIAGTLTSLFGDIPLREAADRNQFPNPSFDPQLQVYDDLQKLLDQANENLGKSGGIPAAQDIFFAGNASKWQATANTLKARYYLQTKNYEAARTAAAAGISEPANDFAVPHKPAIGGAQNVYFQFLVQQRQGYLSATDSYAAQLLDSARVGKPNNHNSVFTNESKRFAYYFTKASGPDKTDYGIQEGKGFSAEGESFPLVTYSENQLIIAEASARLGDNDGALQALNLHRAALQKRFPKGRYLAYKLTDLPGSDSDNAKLLREILTERYLTFISQINAFNDARRTNNALNLPIKRTGATTLPQRFLYPQSEINTNPTNVPNPLPGLYEITPVNR